MAGTEIQTPDERLFRAHVTSGNFRAIEDRGDWRLLRVRWPHVLVAVAAAERPNGPTHFVLSAEVSGYAGQAPAGMLWDLARSQPLSTDLLPKGDRAAIAFRSGMIYTPFDRAGLASHSEWRQQNPRDAWTSERDFAFYLRKVWDLVNAGDYQGI